MDDQLESFEASRAASRQRPTDEGAGTRLDATSRERTYETTDGYVGIVVKEMETVTFKNHNGDRYVWPFELCRSYTAIGPLIEAVYARWEDTDLMKEILRNEYDIVTGDGAKILPVVWESIVRPFLTIQIQFWPRKNRYASGHYLVEDRRPRSLGSEVRSIDVYQREYQPEPSANLDIDHPSANSEDDDLSDSTSDEAEEEGAPEFPGVEETLRESIFPVDSDGNKLSFRLDTVHPKWQPPAPNKYRESDNADTKLRNTAIQATDIHLETLRISKAASTEIDNRSLIQLHTLPGPGNAQLKGSTRMTWHHITAARLDYAHFKSTCLTVPDLSERLQKLTRELLTKVENENVKAFLDGMFIEPGTVLRVDEQGQSEPQSVVFSCIPYFDLQPPTKKLSTGLGDRLFPPRTLMQSYYPYEPVRDRDVEQAYRKFGNDRTKNLVQVPNLWMMNIGTDIVVTCGHRALTQEMVKSIAIMQEDLKKIGTKSTENSLTTIRLTDRNGQTFLLSLQECRSYFQMQQRIREFKSCTRTYSSGRALDLENLALDGKGVITPEAWGAIIQKTDSLFIDIALTNIKPSKSQPEGVAKVQLFAMSTHPAAKAVPPFFHWPCRSVEGIGEDELNIQNFIPTDVKRSMRNLADAEKGMLSETLDTYATYTAVDRTFTSTTYYKSLPEGTYQHLCTEFASLAHISLHTLDVQPTISHHQIVVDAQYNAIVEHSVALFGIAHATLGLFVADVDQSTMLRKFWGAMSSIYQNITTIIGRGVTGDPDELTGSKEEFHSRTKTGWFIRNPSREGSIVAPGAERSFRRSIKRCQRCRSTQPFDSPDAAIEHLQKHVKRDQGSALPEQAQAQESGSSGPDLKRWVSSDTQLKREEKNDGVVAILTQTCETAKGLFSLAKELADGVKNEDGKMSESYTFPAQLVSAFREIVVFYLATERAVYYSNESYKSDATSDDESLPFSDQGLEVLKRFGDGPRRSMRVARLELCDMVKSESSFDVLDKLSLGPEYVCAWLMRRLLVKPLEKAMTVGDMYREYLSTIQFQVNHRPGKRLLRDINLLQEELNVLSEVNSWQMKLIQNYIAVLDDISYEKDIPARRAMFPYEHLLLTSCLENLSLASEDCAELKRRCGPLSERTKQSLEINEEDHGKAIMVFTIVTVVFLPLSFVTSYLGMNTVDIRDMGSEQSLFYIIAIPLTVVTVGACLLIGYNGDDLRDLVVSVYGAVTGKQDGHVSARGISVAQRKRVRKLHGDSSSTLDYDNLAADAEYASPRPNYCLPDDGRVEIMPIAADAAEEVVEYAYAEPATVRLGMSAPRAKFQTQSFAGRIPIGAPQTPPPMEIRPIYNSGRSRVQYNPYRDRRTGIRPGYNARPRRAPGLVNYAMPPIRRPVSAHEVEVEEEVHDEYVWHKKRRQRPVGGREGRQANTWRERR